MANRDIYITVQNVKARSRNGRFLKGPHECKAKETGFKELSPIHSFPTGPWRTQPPKNLRVSLSILRASHQTYDEARLLPYTHNTFHMEVDTLEYFLDGRAPYQKQSLRSLSLRMDMFGLHSELYTQCLMLIASYSLPGVRKLRVFTEIGIVSDEYDLTSWLVGLKIWGIRQLDLGADLTVDVDPADGTFISGGKLQQMKQIARIVGQELSDRDMVDKHRVLATDVFKKLLRRLPYRLMKSMVQCKDQNIGGWLPAYPKTMV
jgi:hypothetical protein